MTCDGAMAQAVSRGLSPRRPGLDARPGFTPGIIIRVLLATVISPLLRARSFYSCSVIFSVVRVLSSLTSVKLTRCQSLVSN